mmetsp:Transcript_18588/g.41738  ORF Transcript_18588/g.41738 Transcript_18588/m.41738 type:complete len:84 (-) Transcript_18588:2002-2253(-)
MTGRLHGQRWTPPWSWHRLSVGVTTPAEWLPSWQSAYISNTVGKIHGHASAAAHSFMPPLSVHMPRFTSHVPSWHMRGKFSGH